MTLRILYRACLLGVLVAGPIYVARPIEASGLRSAATLVSGSHLAAQEGEEKGAESGTRELLVKVINFVILVGVLIYLLRTPIANYLAQRAESIRKSLEEGRQALEAASARLNAVEGKLAHLEEEIAEFKAAATREMEAERERLLKATLEEAEKISQSVRAQIESATRAARLQLKVEAAERAIELAEGIIRGHLDDAGRRRLVRQFVDEIAEQRRSQV